VFETVRLVGKGFVAVITGEGPGARVNINMLRQSGRGEKAFVAD